MPPDSEDRRHSRRVSYPCDARCYGVGESLLDAHLTDVSPEGAFVETAAEMPIGTILLLRFKIGERRLTIEASVVHCVPGRGLGVRFEKIGDQERRIIEGLASADAD